MDERFYHDHETLEEFVRALAKATEYSSYSCGPYLSTYWKEEAEEWVKEFSS